MAGLGWVPALMVFVMATGFVVAYIMAILRDHVNPLFPYISDAGTTIPESCVFGEFLTIGTFLGVVMVYLRYRLIRHITHHEVRRINIANNISLVLGMLIAFGITLVANFQATSVVAVHMVGAFFAFGFGTVYVIIQAMITKWMHPDFNGLYIYRVRLVLAVCYVITFIITVAAGATASAQWRLGTQTDDDRKHWQPDDDGYVAHLFSSFCEWAMAFLVFIYFFTFIREFNMMKISIKTEMDVTHLDQVPLC